tara:strand:+ start:2035 stop:2637 length:603 start_codon:yes stop_codon:yes gene_type:complete
MPIEKVEMGDYSNTVIYILCSNDPEIEEKYIGHSKDFHRRKLSHKSDCNNVKRNEYNTPVYVFIRGNGGFDNWDFEILERANLKDIDEAETLERYWIETLKPTLNKKLPGLKPEERKEFNRKHSLIRYNKLKQDPEFRKIIYERNKKQKEDNPEKVAAVAESVKEKITCVCGAIHSRNGKSQHLKTDKHKEFVENNPQEV